MVPEISLINKLKDVNFEKEFDWWQIVSKTRTAVFLHQLCFGCDLLASCWNGPDLQYSKSVVNVIFCMNTQVSICLRADTLILYVGFAVMGLAQRDISFACRSQWDLITSCMEQRKLKAATTSKNTFFFLNLHYSCWWYYCPRWRRESSLWYR